MLTLELFGGDVHKIFHESFQVVYFLIEFFRAVGF